MICSKCRQKRGNPKWWPNLVPGVCEIGGHHTWINEQDLDGAFDTGINAFEPLLLTMAGRPVLVEGEIEICVQDGIALYNGDHQTDYQDGSLYLSTQRVMYVEKGNTKRAIALPLSQVDLPSPP